MLPFARAAMPAPARAPPPPVKHTDEPGDAKMLPARRRCRDVFERRHDKTRYTASSDKMLLRDALHRKDRV